MPDGRKWRRRTLLQAGVAGLAVLAAAPAKAALWGAGEPWATLIDVDRCTGCGACVAACRKRSLAEVPMPTPPIPQPARSGPRLFDWSSRRDEQGRLTPFNWLFIQTSTVMAGGAERHVHLPRRCLHCLNPQCVSLCPSGAMWQTPEGATFTAHGLCMGDGPCIGACPWNIPQRQSGVGPYLHLAPRHVGNGMTFKCDFCHRRLAEGNLPLCVEACAVGAMRAGPRSVLAAEARRLAAERSGEIFGLQENGGTNTFYVSSVPFRDIEASLLRAGRIGYGSPSLRPARAGMNKQNRLRGVVLSAPCAGAGLGALSACREKFATRREKGRPLFSSVFGFLWLAALAVALWSGLAHIPLFTRLGLMGGWRPLHPVAHYWSAAALLLLAGYAVALWCLHGRKLYRLTARGWERVVLLALLFGSGLALAAHNMPHFSLYGASYAVCKLLHCLCVVLALLLYLSGFWSRWRGTDCWLRPRDGA